MLSFPSWTHHTFQTACPVLIRKPFYHLIRLRVLGGQTQIRFQVAAGNALIKEPSAFAHCGHKSGHIQGLRCPRGQASHSLYMYIICVCVYVYRIVLHVAQAGLKFTMMPRMTLNFPGPFTSTSLKLRLQAYTTIRGFMRCRDLNPEPPSVTPSVTLVSHKLAVFLLPKCWEALACDHPHL